MFGVRRQIVRDKYDWGYGLSPTPKFETWSKRLMYHFWHYYGDRQEKLSRRRRQGVCHIADLHMLVQLWLWGERWTAFQTDYFNSNKINNNPVKIFVQIGDIPIFVLRRGVKALWLIFHILVINLIYFFFITSLISVIKRLWLVSLVLRVLVYRGLETICCVIWSAWCWLSYLGVV